jgi:hypothetical protein
MTSLFFTFEINQLEKQRIIGANDNVRVLFINLAYERHRPNICLIPYQKSVKNQHLFCHIFGFSNFF